MTSDTQLLAEKYIAAMELALKDLTRKEGQSIATPDRVEVVIDAAKRYMMDSKYYLDNKKDATALASISYAEGLLDALRILDFVDFTWKRAGQC